MGILLFPLLIFLTFMGIIYTNIVKQYSINIENQNNYEKIYSKDKKIKTLNNNEILNIDNERLLNIFSNQIFIQKTIGTVYLNIDKREELENLFIQTCQRVQAAIIMCKECYLFDNCPNTIKNLCIELKDLNEYDSKVVWGFLSNYYDDSKKIYYGEIKNLNLSNGKPLNNLTNKKDFIENYGKFLLNNTFNQNSFNKYVFKISVVSKYKDPCGLNDIIIAK